MCSPWPREPVAAEPGFRRHRQIQLPGSLDRQGQKNLIDLNVPRLLFGTVAIIFGGWLVSGA